jgi:hypothetical protein
MTAAVSFVTPENYVRAPAVDSAPFPDRVPAAWQNAGMAVRCVGPAFVLLLTAGASSPGAAFAFEGPVGLVGLAEDNRLLLFTSDRPAAAKTVKVTKVSGVLVGIDYRPSNGRLYGLSSANNLYTIDPQSGVATPVNTLTTPFDGGPRSGFDFNPQSDRLRIVGGSGQNLRVHPNIGAAATDTALAYAPKDPNFRKKPLVVACAYTNSVARAPTTKAYDIDAALDVLVLQDPPNDGTLQTVGPLGADFDVATGFDIVTDAQGRDRAFAASGGALYAIDLATGASTRLGVIGQGGLRLVGLAAALPAGP